MAQEQSTRVDTASFIEDAFRLTGVLASTISGEMLSSARRSLYYQLSGLSNRGLNLWMLRKWVFPLRSLTAVYDLPEVVTDIYNSLWRQVTELEAAAEDFAVVGEVTVEYLEPVKPTAFLVEFTGAEGDVTATTSYSHDGVAWEQLDRQQIPVVGARVVVDLDKQAEAAFWRVAIDGATFTRVQGYLTVNDIPMAKLNRDDYTNLPQKTFEGQGGRALQYFFDKQIVPQMRLWPMPADDANLVVVWAQWTVPTPEKLSGYVSVPQRWQQALLYDLSWRLGLLAPPGLVDPARTALLKAQAEEFLVLAERGERDGSSYRLTPAIGGYNR